MNKDDIIRMAHEAGLTRKYRETDLDVVAHSFTQIERFAALVAAAEREKVAQWMMQRGYATGHGDTTEDLLQELDWQIADGWNRALMNGVKTEREECAKVCEDLYDNLNDDLDCRKRWPEQKRRNDIYAAAIRARGAS